MGVDGFFLFFSFKVLYVQMFIKYSWGHESFMKMIKNGWQLFLRMLLGKDLRNVMQNVYLLAGYAVTSSFNSQLIVNAGLAMASAPFWC